MATLDQRKSQLADEADKPMIGNRQAAITNVTVTGTYATDDSALETAINSLITALEAHGLIESND
jgi:hypothetical protein